MGKLGTQKLGTATLGSDDKIISVPKTHLTHTTPNPTLDAGAVSISVPKTQLTQTTPPLTINAVTEISIPKTQLTQTIPKLTLEAGETTISVTETQLTQTTPSPTVTGGPASITVPETQLTQTTPALTLEPEEALISVPTTTLTITNPDSEVVKVFNINSPTKVLITTPDKFVNMQSKTFKEGDLGDELNATLEDDNGAIDLSTANKVEIVMEDRDKTVQLDAEVSITDASAGKIEYDWSPGDPIETAGVYRAEFRITDNTGDTETVPNNSYKSIKIEKELG